MPTALQIAQVRQTPLTAGLFMAMFKEAPLLAALQARPNATKTFKGLAMSALPTAHPFVNNNEGYTSYEGAFTLRSFEASKVGGKVQTDVSAARAWDAEAAGAGLTWFDILLESQMAAQGIALSKQIIQGTTLDAKGFPGLKQLTPFVSGNTLTDTESVSTSEFSRSVINAAGTTDNTATSVYAIVEGPLDTQLVLCNAGTAGDIFTMEQEVYTMLPPDSSDTTKTSLHRVQQFEAYLGLSVAGMNQVNATSPVYQRAVRRYANLTGDSGKGMTDARMQRLARSFGGSKRPTLFVMATRSGEQLAASRQASAVFNVNMGPGAASSQTFNAYPAPPETWEGIRIVYDDQAIGTTDALES